MSHFVKGFYSQSLSPSYILLLHIIHIHACKSFKLSSTYLSASLALMQFSFIRNREYNFLPPRVFFFVLLMPLTQLNMKSTEEMGLSVEPHAPLYNHHLYMYFLHSTYIYICATLSSFPVNEYSTFHSAENTYST